MNEEEEIKKLQQTLVDADLLSDTDVDGVYGPKTEAALAEYRKSHPIVTIPHRFGNFKSDLINYVTTNPAAMAARSFVTTAVNNIINGIMGNKTKKTYVNGATIHEEDLPTNVQNEIIKQTQWAIDRDKRIANAGGVDAYFLKNPNDTLQIAFPAWSYYKTTRGTRYGNDTGNYSSLDNIFGINPETNVEHTLGHFNIALDRGGYTITDTYDFNKGTGNYSHPKTLYEQGRVFMQQHGPQEDDPEDSKIHYNLRFDYLK